MQEQTSSLDCSDTHSASPESFTTVVQPFVRKSLQALSAMSDSAIQEYIHQCATHFIAAQRRWEQTGNFADVGERDSCWCAEADALIELGSRPGAVARIRIAA